MRNYFSATGLAFGLALGGCAAAGPSSGGAPASAPTLATIVGPVASIDGKVVKHVGKPVQVPPGSHVVRTATRYIVPSNASNSPMVQFEVPAVDFSLPTRAGLEYYVERQILEPTSQSSPVRLVAYERDSSGKVLQTFAPSQNVTALRATRLMGPP